MQGIASILVAALGQRQRGDDAFGGWVLDVLRKEGIDGMELLDLTAAGPAALLDRLEGRTSLIVVDAIQAPGSAAGELLDLDGHEPSALPLVAERASSTHAWSLGEQLRLAAALGMLPLRVRIIGAVVGSVGWGEEPGGEMKLAAVRSAGRVLEWVERWRREDTWGRL